MISRQDLVDELAKVSHATYLKQKKRAMETNEPPADPNNPSPTDHDRERAEDTVQALERLGIYG